MDKIYNDIIGYIITFLDEKSIICLGMTSKKFYSQYLKYLKSIDINGKVERFSTLFNTNQYIKLKLFYKDIFDINNENKKLDLIFSSINAGDLKLLKFIFKVSNNNIKTKFCNIIAKKNLISTITSNYELYNFLCTEIKKNIPHIDINSHLYPGYNNLLLLSGKTKEGPFHKDIQLIVSIMFIMLIMISITALYMSCLSLFY